MKNWARSRRRALASRSRRKVEGVSKDRHVETKQRRDATQVPSALRVGAAPGRLRRCGSLTMLSFASPSSPCLASGRAALPTRPDPVLQRAAKCPRTPALNGRGRRDAIVGRVDLDGVVSLRVDGEALRLGQARGVKNPLPVVVIPAGGPDVDLGGPARWSRFWVSCLHRRTEDMTNLLPVSFWRMPPARTRLWSDRYRPERAITVSAGPEAHGRPRQGTGQPILSARVI